MRCLGGPSVPLEGGGGNGLAKDRYGSSGGQVFRGVEFHSVCGVGTDGKPFPFVVVRCGRV